MSILLIILAYNSPQFTEVFGRQETYPCVDEPESDTEKFARKPTTNVCKFFHHLCYRKKFILWYIELDFRTDK